MLHTAVAQRFTVEDPNGPDVVGNTSATLLPSAVYAVGFWIKWSNSDEALDAGVLEVALADRASSDADVNDDAGNANKVVLDHSDISNNWVFHGFFIRTPKTMPLEPELIVRLTTPATFDAHICVGGMAMCPASQLYQGGPYLAAFRGLNNARIDDSFAWRSRTTGIPGPCSP